MGRLSILIAVLASSAGCAVTELRKDQDMIRSALLDLNTAQIMDNLIRASNGLPIIHIDYINANANVTMECTAGLNDAIATTSSNVLTLAAAKTLQITHQTVNTLISSLGNIHTNQVAVTANPVLTSNELYNAYLAFLGLPGSMQVTDAPPPCGAAHICKRWCNQYYWIPVHYRDDFFQLALVTTAQRDRLIETPEMYSVQIRGFDLKSKLETPKRSDEIIIDAIIDKHIPNEQGFQEKVGYRPGLYTVDGAIIPSVIDLAVYEPYKRGEDGNYEPKGKGFAVDPTKTVYETNHLRLTLKRDYFEQLQRMLPFDAKVKLESTPPPAPTTDELLQRIPFRYPQIQIEKSPGQGHLRMDAAPGASASTPCGKTPTRSLSQMSLEPPRANQFAKRPAPAAGDTRAVVIPHGSDSPNSRNSALSPALTSDARAANGSFAPRPSVGEGTEVTRNGSAADLNQDTSVPKAILLPPVTQYR